jgi:hypothetical protein
MAASFLWRQAPDGKGLVIQWRDFEEYCGCEQDVASGLRAFLTTSKTNK